MRISALSASAIGGILIATTAAWLLWPENRPTAPISSNPPPPPTPAHLAPDDAIHSQYAGSQSCQPCHTETYRRWQQSNHHHAERNVSPAKDHDAFQNPQPEPPSPAASPAFLDAQGVSSFLALSKNNQPTTVQAIRVIGHNPLRQFLVPGPNGRFQTMESAWDPAKKQWFNVFGEDSRNPGEWTHWSGQGMNWNSMCAACHNTRLRKNFDPKTDSYHTRMAEMSVGCESCHGPMKNHVDWQQPLPPTLSPRPKDPTIKPLNRDQFFDTCGACHSRRAEVSGDLIPGEDFHQHFQLTFTDETSIYHPDGQIHDENYEYASMLSSKMHGAGVRCVDCHDPHTGKRLIEGNMLCMRCHGAPVDPPAPIINPKTHSPCGENTSGGQCTSCHMPTTTYMQRHPRHDHGFTIPDPLLTRETGTPNACNRCHTEKSTDWAIEQSSRWYGDRMNRPTRTRALLFAQARKGTPSALPQLIEFLSDTSQPPIWTAGACRLLSRWALTTTAQYALLSKLQHPNAMVRMAAIQALNPAIRETPTNTSLSIPIQSLLSDPSRSVRTAAAWALAHSVDLNSQAGKELSHMLSLWADQPTGQAQLAQFEHLRGRSDLAIAHMQKAIQLDPLSTPFHHDLAMLFNATGNTEGCIQSLKEAIRLAPQEAEYTYKLALALHESGRIQEAITALKQTVSTEPSFSRAWYNLGIAYQSSQQSPLAIQALSKAESLDAADASIPYALATVYANSGNRASAIEALKRALTANPQHAESMNLLKLLSR